MAIDKKLIHFTSKEKFISQGVGSEENISTPTDGSEENRNAVYGQLKGTSIAFIKDSKEIWTHGNLYKSVNWSTIDSTTPIINNQSLYEILNADYTPTVELDNKTATRAATVSLLKQNY